jgi:hypothetical protein
VWQLGSAYAGATARHPRSLRVERAGISRVAAARVAAARVSVVVIVAIAVLPAIPDII